MQKAQVLGAVLKRWRVTATFAFTKLLSFDHFIYKL